MVTPAERRRFLTCSSAVFDSDISIPHADINVKIARVILDCLTFAMNR